MWALGNWAQVLILLHQALLASECIFCHDTKVTEAEYFIKEKSWLWFTVLEAGKSRIWSPCLLRVWWWLPTTPTQGGKLKSKLAYVNEMEEKGQYCFINNSPFLRFIFILYLYAHVCDCVNVLCERRFPKRPEEGGRFCATWVAIVSCLLWVC